MCRTCCTKPSLGNRILELRLQKAHAMLADRRNINLRVSEIALTSGFSDIPISTNASAAATARHRLMSARAVG